MKKYIEDINKCFSKYSTTTQSSSLSEWKSDNNDNINNDNKKDIIYNWGK